MEAVLTDWENFGIDSEFQQNGRRIECRVHFANVVIMKIAVWRVNQSFDIIISREGYHMLKIEKASIDLEVAKRLAIAEAQQILLDCVFALRPSSPS